MAYAFLMRHTAPLTAVTPWLMLKASSLLPLLLLLLGLTLLAPTPTAATGIFTTNNNNGDDTAADYNPRRVLLSPSQSIPATSDDCNLCILTGDLSLCRRCLKVEEASFVPRFFPRTADRKEYEEAEEEASAPMTRKRGNSVYPGYQRRIRFQVGSGCSCCYFSRLNNAGCCAACSMTTKRYGKRSGGRFTSEAAMTSEGQSGGGGGGVDSCLCCARTGDTECCRDCFLQ
ncbi:uncharacterized protein LOC143297214 isoform X2 [Babylonia areolata]|uniref:uncharacterized protein LOC143297214 isoform X2 n=1 Tax=Babylonia areolata TaxID=304850 RepID=UPI003FD316EA